MAQRMLFVLALVVGLGRSGLAVARCRDERGVRLRVCDQRPASALQAAARELTRLAA